MALQLIFRRSYFHPCMSEHTLTDKHAVTKGKQNVPVVDYFLGFHFCSLMFPFSEKFLSRSKPEMRGLKELHAAVCWIKIKPNGCFKQEKKDYIAVNIVGSKLQQTYTGTVGFWQLFDLTCYLLDPLMPLSITKVEKITDGPCKNIIYWTDEVRCYRNLKRDRCNLTTLINHFQKGTV